MSESTSSGEFPCPVCHLSFKTEVKVSQHLDKCLASQEREERTSRSRTTSVKRRAEDDDDDGEGGGGSSSSGRDSKRSKKEDQVAAWSGIGLLSPGDPDNKNLSKLKSKKPVGGSSAAGATAKTNAANKKAAPAKKSLTGGKKSVGKDESETLAGGSGKFGDGEGKKDPPPPQREIGVEFVGEEGVSNIAGKNNNSKRKSSARLFESDDDESGGERKGDLDPVGLDSGQTAGEKEGDRGSKRGLTTSYRNSKGDDDRMKTLIVSLNKGKVLKSVGKKTTTTTTTKRKSKSSILHPGDKGEEDRGGEEKEDDDFIDEEDGEVKLKKSSSKTASLKKEKSLGNNNNKKSLTRVTHGLDNAGCESDIVDDLEYDDDSSQSAAPSSSALLSSITVKKTTSEVLSANPKPLAEILRPTELDHLFGQDHEENNNNEGDGRLRDHGGGGGPSANQKTDIRWLKALINARAPIPSIIFWGPPGCGKTTLAKIIANQYAPAGNKNKNNNKKSIYRFVTMSACEAGVADVKKQAEVAKNELKMTKRRTLLFMDEIHRFTKNQQDAFLPIIENGTIVLVGATTENPSFSLNSALLSRCKVVVLNALTPVDVKKILERGVQYLNGVVVNDAIDDVAENKENVPVGQEASPDVSNSEIPDKDRVRVCSTALDVLSHLADGDARVALNGLETAVRTFLATASPSKLSIDANHVKESLQKSHVSYDRAGDQHYQVISAFHKSIRGSDDNAALYWLARMLKGGEDPRYIARRLIRIAAEDIGLGDPNALVQANAAHQAVLAVGMPECDVALAQATVYLARARKSVEVYAAMKKAQNHVAEQMEKGVPGVPLHLRNGSTKLMREMGYGKGYLYNPDCKNGEDDGQTYMPEGCEAVDYFV